MAPLAQPHGFITTTALEAQYRRAHIPNHTPEMHSVKEHETVELLEDIFNKVIWRDNDDIHVNFQQPPEVQSENTCDIVVNSIDESGGKRAAILCFVKHKRDGNATPYKLSAVEKQAVDYCKDYLASEPDLEFIYACTACGARLRLWKFMRGAGEFEPVWGSLDEGSWADYKDVSVDADAREINRTLDSMTG